MGTHEEIFGDPRVGGCGVGRQRWLANRLPSITSVFVVAAVEPDECFFATLHGEQYGGEATHVGRAERNDGDWLFRPTVLNFNVDSALTYAAHTGLINLGEGVINQQARVNSEVGIWDDVGIINEGSTDAPLNTDYTRMNGNGAEVVFNPVPNGFVDLIIAEDAALDPFQLSLCSNAACGTRTIVFDGFDAATANALLALSEFAAGDSSTASEMDQAFVFRFDQTITDYVAVKEFGNFGGQKLEVDFIGTGAVVPIPGAVWLFGTALVGFAAFARKKKMAA